MDVDAIQTAIEMWVKSVTALPCSWENKPQQIQVKLPARVRLTGPVNIAPVGEDYVQWSTVDAGNVQPTVVGHREFDVMLRVISRSQAGNKSAQFWLEKVRAALKRPSALEFFDGAGIAVLSMSKGVQFDAPADDADTRVESVASATLRLTAVISDVDDASVGVLTSALLTTRIEGEDGSQLPTPPNVTDELVTG